MVFVYLRPTVFERRQRVVSAHQNVLFQMCRHVINRVCVGSRHTYAKDCISGRMTCWYRTSTTRSTTTERAVVHMSRATSPTCTAGDLVHLNSVNFVSRKVKSCVF